MFENKDQVLPVISDEDDKQPERPIWWREKPPHANPTPETHVWRKMREGSWRLVDKQVLRWQKFRKKDCQKVVKAKRKRRSDEERCALKADPRQLLKKKLFE